MKYSLSVSSIFLLIVAGFTGGCDNATSQPPIIDIDPAYDFSVVDARFQKFLDDSEQYDGISYTLVDSKQGVVHEAAFEDHTLDIVVLLASASKMPASALLMALHDDDSLAFEVEAPIADYLSWDGVYGDRTTQQLLSNTSGIPGLADLVSYLGQAHECIFEPDTQLETCGEAIYTNLVPDTSPPGVRFDYGGAQWQLAGAVAELVSNSLWAQAFDRYIAQPCDLEVFQFGNLGVEAREIAPGFVVPVNLDISQWTGYPDSLTGVLSNPLLEAGAISNMQDYAKLLMMHLSGGKCGDNRVLSEASVALLQADRTREMETLISGWRYGMGWWIPEGLPGVVVDFGLYGSVGWLDTERGIGGYMATDDYSYTLLNARIDPLAPPAKLVIEEIILLQQQAVDAARATASK